MNQKQYEVLIECGTTYQPLTIGIHLLLQKYDIQRVHILTTHTGYESVQLLLQEMFPTLPFIVYGAFVDGAGSTSDQNEYIRNINLAKSVSKHQIVGLVASGTNWMTWCFSHEMLLDELYFVRTLKEFEDRCFLPAHSPFGVDCEGNVVKNEDGTTSQLVQLKVNRSLSRIKVEDKTIHCLGHEVALSQQEAAMFDYMLSCGGKIDLTDKIHDQKFNQFCEQRNDYDTDRTLVEEFAPRFRQNVSKINAKLEDAHPLIWKHLQIIKESSSVYMITSPEILL